MARLTATNHGMNIFQGMKNRLINGNFDIWQRNVTQTSSGYGSDDRWQNRNVGSTKTNSRQAFTLGQTDVPGNPSYYSRTVVSSSAGANNYVHKTQYIEGVETLSGETVTLSFYAKADDTRSIAVESSQFFGTGGSPDTAVYNFLGKPTLTTSWQKFTYTYTLASVSGKTLGDNGDDCLSVCFWFDAGSTYNSRTGNLGQQSGTFEIAQVQLERGASATEFEQRSISQEILLCMRYYEHTFPDGTYPGSASANGAVSAQAGGASVTFIPGGKQFKVTKHHAPTVTTYSIGTGNSGNIRNITAGADVTVSTIQYISEKGYLYLTLGSATVDNNNYEWNLTMDAEISS